MLSSQFLITAFIVVIAHRDDNHLEDASSAAQMKGFAALQAIGVRRFQTSANSGAATLRRMARPSGLSLGMSKLMLIGLVRG